ncbi:MAG: lipopolysaccharide kinase InaA family protein [Candidatus Binataceae bacterium]
MSNKSEAEFDEFVGGRFRMTLRRDLGSHAESLLQTIRGLREADVPGVGGRASVHRVKLDGDLEVMVRRSLRGGMARHLVSDLFVGIEPRPLGELAVTIEARRRNMRVAEPVGAVIEWIAPVIYRGWFVTRPLSGMTLWEFMQTDDDPAVRGHVLMSTRESISDIEQQGLLHPDLNLQNLFVTKDGEKLVVVILDLDKARFLDWPLPAALRQRQSERLARSAKKLDPARKHFDAKAFSILEIG